MMHGRKPPSPMDARQKMDPVQIRKLFLYNRRYLPPILLSVLMALGGVVLTLIGPERISDLMNLIVMGILTGVSIPEVESVCWSLILIYGISALLTYSQQFITSTITQYTSRRLRTDINRKITRLPLRFFDASSRGDMLSRLTNDVDTISQTLSSSISGLISSMVLFAGCIFKMFQVNWLLALITIGSSFVGFAGMRLIMGRSQKYFLLRQEELGNMNGHIQEVFQNHHIVRAFGARSLEQKVFRETNVRLGTSNWKSQFLSGMMMPLMAFVGNLSYVLIFVAGVASIAGGNPAITLGTIISFTIYARLFSQPLSSLAQSMTSLQQASAAGKRVFEVLDSEEMETETHTLSLPETIRGRVEFEHVRFGYKEDHMILQDFSALIQAGQKVAIVGPTGAGKTTLVNLLMRFYEVQGGRIFVDGVDLRHVKREDVHELFGMILQDTWLFGGTIRDNLIFSGIPVTEGELDRVCDAVGLTHFIRTQEKGYDTVLSDSLNLSEGQKQQMTIARAMIQNAPMMILDEATSSIDTRTELLIQQAMDRLTQGKTSFVIAHRLSTIRNADLILVMRDGNIVEQGTHEELLKKNGFYAELYNSQFTQVA